MKRIKIITLLFLVNSMAIIAQKEIKEGAITMKITMSSDNEQVNTQLAMLGDMSTTTYFKGEKSATVMKNPMTGNNTTIIDDKTKQMLVLMDNPMLGKKFLKSSMEVSEDNLKNISVTENGDSKTILGYKCQGYDVSVKNDDIETKMLMYTTDKISAANQNSSTLGGKLKGYPMYMEINISKGGMPMKTIMEVTEIKNESIDINKFDMTIPEGYSEMTSGN